MYTSTSHSRQIQAIFDTWLVVCLSSLRISGREEPRGSVAKKDFCATLKTMFSAELYLPFYLQGMLVLVLATALVYLRGEPSRATITSFNLAMLPTAAIVLIIFIGTRPLSGVFVDMITYAAGYERTMTSDVASFPDWGFSWLVKTCANLMQVEWFFVLCAILYVLPLWMAMRKIHKEWAFAAFLALAGSLSFFAYGTNGIRNGIATSLLIYAFAFHRNFLAMAILMVVAESMHKSIILPVVMFLFSGIFSRVTLYASVWLFTFVLVTLKGEATAAILGQLNLGEDDRLSGYAMNSGLGNDRGGFRLDFVLYSIVPVLISYAIADAKTCADVLYRRLVCTYLACNSVWLLLMYAAYSNRFAYLSWFLMPWIIVYPFITPLQVSHPEFRAQTNLRYVLLSASLIAHYAFTYVMDLFILPSRGG